MKNDTKNVHTGRCFYAGGTGIPMVVELHTAEHRGDHSAEVCLPYTIDPATPIGDVVEWLLTHRTKSFDGTSIIGIRHQDWIVLRAGIPVQKHTGREKDQTEV